MSLEIVPAHSGKFRVKREVGLTRHQRNETSAGSDGPLVEGTDGGDAIVVVVVDVVEADALNARADAAHAGGERLKAGFPAVKRAGHESRSCVGHAEVRRLAPAKDWPGAAETLGLVVVVDEADVADGQLLVLEAEGTLVGLEGAAEASRVAAVGVDQLSTPGRVIARLAGRADGLGVDDGAAARTRPERGHFRGPQARLEEA